jgi:hypothetical protein
MLSSLPENPAFLKFYPDFSAALSKGGDGNDSFTNSLTPFVNIPLKRWTVSPHFQYVTRSHLYDLESNL